MPRQYRHSGPFSRWMQETGGKVQLVPYGLPRSRRNLSNSKGYRRFAVSCRDTFGTVSAGMVPELAPVARARDALGNSTIGSAVPRTFPAQHTNMEAILIYFIAAAVGVALWVYLVRWTFRIDHIVKRLDQIAKALNPEIEQQEKKQQRPTDKPQYTVPSNSNRQAEDQPRKHPRYQNTPGASNPTTNRTEDQPRKHPRYQ